MIRIILEQLQGTITKNIFVQMNRILSEHLSLIEIDKVMYIV